MKLTFVANYDPTDVRNWSGAPKYMAGALQAAGLELDFLNVGGITQFERVERRLRHNMPERELRAARRFARRIPQGVRVFSPGSVAVALRRDAVFWTDSTFASMVDFYPGWTNLSRHALRAGNELERRALENCAAAIYSSEWAAESAVRDYGTDPMKVHVVSFGANLPHVPSRSDTEQFIAAREQATPRLLFVGYDWNRKGGDTAVAATRTLRARGLDVRLVVIGATPPIDEPWIERHGILHGERDAESYAQLFRRAHLMFLPSKAECSPIVFSDANAFALPVIATRVGGIESVVRNGVNGLLVERDADPDVFADAVEAALTRDGELARASRREYEDRLNWAASGEAVSKILQRLDEA